MYDVALAVVGCKLLADLNVLGICLGFAAGILLASRSPESAAMARVALAQGSQWVQTTARRIGEAARAAGHVTAAPNVDPED